MLRCNFNRLKHSSLIKNSKSIRLLSSIGKELYPGNSSRGIDRLPSVAKVGDLIHGFTVTKVEDIPEYSIQAIRLKHNKTGADYIHIDTDDTNNVFSVCFRTPPSDSTGVPHILEHTVLCGSEKFPVRDPFFNMLKRSLNTFMNAMTASDHTMYPFSTTNEKDWANLLDVYIDAAFFPLLSKEDFQQEGHRLEIEDSSNPETSALVYKGVVYNEMKGTLADNNQYFGTRLQQELLPNTTYGTVSGGDPLNIPDLTYEQLKDFHKKHYHPSNALFYSYGDLSFRKHLQFLDKSLLNRFEYDHESASVTIQNQNPKWTSPRKIEKTCPPDMNGSEDKDQIRICNSMLVGDSRDVYESLVMRVIAYLLLNGSSSPLYQALIDKKLAKDFSAGSGFDSSTLDTSFGVGLQGVSPDVVDSITTVIENTLRTVAENGFDERRLNAVLHQIELGQKHISGNFGLRILHGISSMWCHRGDPIDALSINKHLERLKNEVESSPLFQQYIKKHLLNNPHHLTMTMIPDENFVKKRDQHVEETLRKTKESLTKDEIDSIIQQADILKQRQDEEQDISCLPTLNLSDIPRLAAGEVQPVDESIGNHGVPMQWVFQRTNEVSYFRLLLDASTLPDGLKPYLPIFTSVLTQLGAGKFNHQELSIHMESICGGISCSALTSSGLNDVTSRNEQLLLGTMCLPQHLDEACELIRLILTDTHFNNLNHLENLVLMEESNAVNSIAHSGHSLSVSAASASLTSSCALKEIYGGLTQIQFLKNLVKDFSDKKGVEDLSHKLEAISKHLFHSSNIKCSVVTEEKLKSQAEASLSNNLLNHLPTSQSKLNLNDIEENWPKHYIQLNSNGLFAGFPLAVNFVAQSCPSVPYLHEDHVPLNVLGQLMSSCYLHREVREKGGAYGSGSSQGEGTFSFMSYFDPRTTETLQSYENAKEWAKNGKFNDRDIEEALMSIFGTIDAPTTPSSKGKTEFIQGITSEMRRKRREQYLNITRNQLIDVANKYMIPNSSTSKNVIIGPEANIPSFQQLKWSILS